MDLIQSSTCGSRLDPQYFERIKFDVIEDSTTLNPMPRSPFYFCLFPRSALHGGQPPIALRPASVILNRITSSALLPAITASRFLAASRRRTRLESTTRLRP